MWQPILVRIDAHQIFERAGDANLFVRLQFRQIDEHIGIHRRAAEKILMVRSVVFGVGFRHVVGRAIKTAFPLKPDELARRIKSNERVAERVTRQFGFRHRNAIHRVPFFRPKVEQLKLDVRKVGPASRDQVVQPAVFSDSGEGRISLRRVANRDGAVAFHFCRRPTRRGLDHRRVSYEMLPLIRTRKTLVMLLDPIRLEHDAVAGLNERAGQGERGERLID